MTNGSFVPPPPPANFGNTSGSDITFSNVLGVIRSKYASATGRASLREYWFFYLWNIIIGVGGWIAFIVLAGILSAIMGQNSSQGVTAFLFLALIVVFLALVIPSITAAIRRLHDTGKSGVYLLLGLVPFVGGIIVLVLLAMPSQVGPNQYGPQPN